MECPPNVGSKIPKQGVFTSTGVPGGSNGSNGLQCAPQLVSHGHSKSCIFCICSVCRVRRNDIWRCSPKHIDGRYSDSIVHISQTALLRSSGANESQPPWRPFAETTRECSQADVGVHAIHFHLDMCMAFEASSRETSVCALSSTFPVESTFCTVQAPPPCRCSARTWSGG